MIYLLTIVVAASRFLPHPPNFACVGALGLFAGCYMAGRKAYLLPPLALLLSDVVGYFAGHSAIGMYNPLVMAATYSAACAAVPLGRWLRSKQTGNRVHWLRLPLGAVGGATLFFLISNFGVWLGPWYPNTLSGCLSCYVAAIPFYANTLAGDLFFAVVLFGAYELSRSPLASPARSFAAASQ